MDLSKSEIKSLMEAIENLTENTMCEDCGNGRCVLDEEGRCSTMTLRRFADRLAYEQ